MVTICSSVHFAPKCLLLNVMLKSLVIGSLLNTEGSVVVYSFSTRRYEMICLKAQTGYFRMGTATLHSMQPMYAVSELA